MKLKLITALAAGLMAATPAFANSVTLDFEGIASFDSVGGFYSSQGINFGLDALAFAADGTTGVANPPSGVNIMSPVGPDAALNTFPLFGVSFSYSASEATSVSLWSGANGTGSLLGTIALAATNADPLLFDTWSTASLMLGGGLAARSITFGDAANVAGFDDVVATIPEPSTYALMGLGLAGLGVFLRKGRRQGAA